MSENSGKKFGLLLKWPKHFRRRPSSQSNIPHSYRLPDDDDEPPELAIGKVFERAHRQASEQDETNRLLSRNRWIVVTVAVIGLALLAISYINRLQEKLESPDYTIKTHDAQQRIIYGPYYDILKSRHPEDPIIPPMDQWDSTNRR